MTGGSNAGIMKLCGEAVHDYILAHGEKDNSLVTIGVATWGVITNRHTLVSKDVSISGTMTFNLTDICA